MNEKKENKLVLSAMQYTPKSSTTFVLVLLLFFLVSSILFLIFSSSLSLNHVVQSDFLDPMNELIGVVLLRPMVVSVFERVSASAFDDQSHYNERLIVVHPNNWLIYTVNGITFNYITNNVNNAVSKCTTPNALNAVEYRLRTVDESADYTIDRLRFSCVNYSVDQLVKIFGSYAQRTDIDMTDYFDKEKRSDAPMFTVENVLQFLVLNALV